MHRAQQTIRVALFVAALVAVAVANDERRQSLNCKNIARNVILNSCKGRRIKRTTEDLDQDILADQMKIDAVDTDNVPPMIQRKRQWGLPPRLPGGYSGSMAGSHHITELATPLLNFYDDRQTDTVNQQFGPEAYLPMPYQPMGSMMNPEFRHSDPDELLGYDLSAVELEELHREMGERMPRNSKALNTQIFLKVAKMCCPDEKVCYNNPDVIPCMGF
ncbi:uncharacterized protein LOC122396602 [Colletes gigas]|uniref:uncharacterized protein LOC122396602 n=1 Tax=Colletes gigas TaxID=935657 RepID=UPI001C9B5DE9|nr:uncharacterized protein LOC122396602 [Colletes gigas]